MVSVPVSVFQENGHFVAELVGYPACRATGETKEIAVNRVRAQLTLTQPQGEVVWVPVERRGVQALFGIFKEDPTLESMVEEIYVERDRQRDEAIRHEGV